MIAGAALLLSHLTAGNHFWVAYVAAVLAEACMYAPYGPFHAIILRCCQAVWQEKPWR